MEKQRKWQFTLIMVVIALTFYNILPTVFYYAQPLKKPISVTEAAHIETAIQKRVDLLEEESVQWLASYCDLLHVTPLSITVNPQHPDQITVRFAKTEEAQQLRAYLPRAGALIPFSAAQLSLASTQETGKDVLIQRKIPLRLKEQKDLFAYIPVRDETGAFTSSYKELLLDRASRLLQVLTGPSESAQLLQALERAPVEAAHLLALQLQSFAEGFEKEPLLANRLAASLTQGSFSKRADAVQALSNAFAITRDNIKHDKASLANAMNEEATEEQIQQKRFLEKKETAFLQAGNLLKKYPSLFAKGKEPWTASQIQQLLETTPVSHHRQTISLEERNPVFSELVIDWEKEQIYLKMHADLTDEKLSSFAEQIRINEVAKIDHLTKEPLSASQQGYVVAFHNLADTTAILRLDLQKLAESYVAQITSLLQEEWQPTHPDLQQLKVVDASSYLSLSAEEQSLCLLVYAPLHSSSLSLDGLQNGSIYVLSKGLDRLIQTFAAVPDAEQSRLFHEETNKLVHLLRKNGFVGHQSLPAFSQGKLFTHEIGFEKSHFYQPLLEATRESFSVQGNERFAQLELSDRQQRILTQNRIETQLHQELLKWKDEYHLAQVKGAEHGQREVPKPTASAFWSNLSLSARKYFRGDEKKVIRWGLDLSGGKTVQIELRDANQQVVTDEASLKQGINELYHRVNRMGVSEVSIRQVGNQIVLDFPSSQALSASELIQASSMYFHVVNEKFSTRNPMLAQSVHQFLQEVWNEAVVTHRKDPKSINLIAWKHLYGDGADAAQPQPRSEAARTLLENGLHLPNPADPSICSECEDAFSKIAVLRGSSPQEWYGQSHPLLFVFKNYALEGSQLENIQASYNPTEGNYLSFQVKSSAQNRLGQRIYPNQDLYQWTSRYSKEQIGGTPQEIYTQGDGWRMAVVLNDTIISSPSLKGALKDQAMISGNFSQREVTQLASDLQAGSLSFTPHILSEKNVSPELGKADRMQGILATLVALLLVIVAMVGYYRFAGLVASVAVLFNLLIIWAILQNIGATLTLAGIAGIILNIGMAVDANVLVFERIKEEYALTGRIAGAISAGYQKAYSAIIDSNVTTIIAALILMNFDAGPIKAFAITLIIGIASSMFTALFMTRYYFSGWVQNPKHQVLKMADWIQAKSIDFLKASKIAFPVAIAVIGIGCALVYNQRASIFGMDFTGGYSLQVEIEPQANTDYIDAVQKAFTQRGISAQDIHIRQLSPANHLRILLSTHLEKNAGAFQGMPVETEEGTFAYPYQKNPRIDWVVQTLASQGLPLSSSSLSELHTNWTAMSGQMSESMRNQAAIGLLISFVCIFIYIAIRFEYKFAAAAILCLLHDVLITLACIGIFHAFQVPVQIDLNTVAALMTIVGYSLNDTIIVFDRIREEMQEHPKWALSELVNRALNSTLSRTTITSGTTLLVLIALVALGGASVFSFAFVMTVGVFFGTLSSWYIASPLMLFFHRQEKAREKGMVQQA